MASGNIYFYISIYYILVSASLLLGEMTPGSNTPWLQPRRSHNPCPFCTGGNLIVCWGAQNCVLWTGRVATGTQDHGAQSEGPGAVLGTWMTSDSGET